jgi:hypothetical protein
LVALKVKMLSTPQSIQFYNECATAKQKAKNHKSINFPMFGPNRNKYCTDT